MNKSLLIVICDFLLLSLLSIANFDKPDKSNAQKRATQTALENETFVQTQMLETLKTALDAEQQRHLSLSKDVEKLSQKAEANLKQAQTQQEIAKQREQQLKKMQSIKLELEQERAEILKRSKDLEAKVASADKRNAILESEIISATDKLEKSAKERIDLERKLGKMQQSDATIKTQLQSVQEQLRQNKENLVRLQTESDKLKLENRAIEAEKRALSTQLEVAATKTKIYEENLKRAQVLIDIEKAEKEKIITHAETLSTNVSTLASEQKSLSKNIVDLRPQTASETFEKIKPLFARIVFKFSEGGLLGKKNATKSISTLPIRIGSRTFLFFNADASPLRFSKDAEAPEMLSVSIFANGKVFTPQTLILAKGSNTTLAIELPKDFIPESKSVELAQKQETFKFPECIVINPNSKYYGQVPFMANFTKSQYAKVDVGLIESIFKTFSPSANDIAMTRSGQALGIMTSTTDLFIPRNLQPERTLSIGKNYQKALASAFIRR